MFAESNLKLFVGGITEKTKLSLYPFSYTYSKNFLSFTLIFTYYLDSQKIKDREMKQLN